MLFYLKYPFAHKWIKLDLSWEQFFSQEFSIYSNQLHRDSVPQFSLFKDESDPIYQCVSGHFMYQALDFKKHDVDVIVTELDIVSEAKHFPTLETLKETDRVFRAMQKDDRILFAYRTDHHGIRFAFRVDRPIANSQEYYTNCQHYTNFFLCEYAAEQFFSSDVNSFKGEIYWFYPTNNDVYLNASSTKLPIVDKAIYTISFGKRGNEIEKLTLPSIQKYANMLNVPLIVLRQNKKRHPSAHWMKFDVFEDALEKGFKKILYVDIDVVVLERDKNIFEEFDGLAMRDHGPYWKEDLTPKYDVYYNTGVMVLDRPALELLSEVSLDYNYKDVWPVKLPDPSEQSFLNKIIRDKKIEVTEMDSSWNKINREYVEGEQISMLHFAGLSHRTRLELIQAFLESSDYRQYIASHKRLY